MQSNSTKTCPYCREEKPIEAYYVRRMPDGRIKAGAASNNDRRFIIAEYTSWFQQRSVK